MLAAHNNIFCFGISGHDSRCGQLAGSDVLSTAPNPDLPPRENSVCRFHCSSSLGRAPRCAGWFADALPPDSQCKVFILEGGIKAWQARFGEDAQMIIEMPPAESVTGVGK
ncbi:hypothetical protein B0F90DRAFT_1276143 [Multifurca ochricompacta]|uniref:Rhodanese domain-containing protein n=1 Tax=Multifurca ochricompacta TaxID=376703 RepID=A0AAD4QKM6_9AGAM|nr:hypothetical protein B0F90DRAFT_1276143 [Multifurca ochricompacta]